MSFEEFQDNHVSAQSDLRFGRRFHLKNGMILAEWNDFSNSESLCHSDASHRVLAQSDLRFGGSCRLKNFKIAAMVAFLDIGTERF